MSGPQDKHHPKKEESFFDKAKHHMDSLVDKAKVTVHHVHQDVEHELKKGPTAHAHGHVKAGGIDIKF